jgi:hypothetical protein
MKISANTKADYLNKIGERAEDLAKMDQLILKHAKNLEPSVFSGLSGSWLAYGMVPYQTKSMKEPSEWPLLALAAQKNYLALYACVVVDGEYIAERYGTNLGKVNCGKSCIRFKKYSDLDEKTLIKMLNEINERYKNGEKLYG